MRTIAFGGLYCGPIYKKYLVSASSLSRSSPACPLDIGFRVQGLGFREGQALWDIGLRVYAPVILWSNIGPITSSLDLRASGKDFEGQPT